MPTRTPGSATHLNHPEGNLSDMRRILARVGMPLNSAERVSEGSSAGVWKVETAQGWFAFRMSNHPERELAPTVDCALRTALIAAGGAAIEPVAHSDDGTASDANFRWVLEPFLDGHHPGRGAVAPAACRDLGRTLAALHSLPASGFGRIARVEGDVFLGCKPTPRGGAENRFDAPLPTSGGELDEHPLVASLPGYWEAIATRLTRVTARLSEARSAVCHTDLHERQMILRDDGSLAALIDFGGAAVLDPCWDFGSLRYFHGPECTGQVLDGYRSRSGLPDPDPDLDLRLIDSFSLCIALHHAARSRLPGKEHRLDAAIRHTVSILGGLA